jgi:hypothetical protein
VNLMPLMYNDPEHWRKRAEEARQIAEQMTDAVGKKAMLQIAGRYHEIADRAAAHQAGKTAVVV